MNKYIRPFLTIIPPLKFLYPLPLPVDPLFVEESLSTSILVTGRSLNETPYKRKLTFSHF